MISPDLKTVTEVDPSDINLKAALQESNIDGNLGARAETDPTTAIAEARAGGTQTINEAEAGVADITSLAKGLFKDGEQPQAELGILNNELTSGVAEATFDFNAFLNEVAPDSETILPSQVPGARQEIEEEINDKVINAVPVENNGPSDNLDQSLAPGVAPSLKDPTEGVTIDSLREREGMGPSFGHEVSEGEKGTPPILEYESRQASNIPVAEVVAQPTGEQRSNPEPYGKGFEGDNLKDKPERSPEIKGKESAIYEAANLVDGMFSEHGPVGRLRLPDVLNYGLRKAMPTLFRNKIDGKQGEVRFYENMANKESVFLSKISSKYERMALEKKHILDNIEDVDNKLKELRGNIRSTQEANLLAKLEEEQKLNKENLAKKESTLTILTEQHTNVKAALEGYEKTRTQAAERVVQKIQEKIAPREQVRDELENKREQLLKRVQEFEKYKADILTQKLGIEGRPHNRKLMRAFDKELAVHQISLGRAYKELNKVEARLLPIKGLLMEWSVKKGEFDEIAQAPSEAEDLDTNSDSSRDVSPSSQPGTLSSDPTIPKDINTAQNNSPIEDTEGPNQFSDEVIANIQQEAQKNIEMATMPLSQLIKSWNVIKNKKYEAFPKIDTSPKASEGLKAVIMLTNQKFPGFTEKASYEAYKFFLDEYIKQFNIGLNKKQRKYYVLALYDMKKLLDVEAEKKRDIPVAQFV